MVDVSTQSYKGVRDFYPEDQRAQSYIFNTWRRVVETYGYEEIGASPLEPSELYAKKTSQEIISEQTYEFKDRGKRKVTLRPEMTPTVARMVAARKRDLPLPIRWYSIPNLFRYEKPQRGRLREHFQLNVDMFGADTLEADSEIITLAIDIMKAFGATPKDYHIQINDRRIVNDLYKAFGIKKKEAAILSKVIDKKQKVSATVFEESLQEILGAQTSEFIETLESNQALIQKLGDKNEHVQQLIEFINTLDAQGITNVFFTPTLMRGFDYYTGLVFEVFDTDSKNKRSLFGGGRYDNLLSLFGEETMPAIGFGVGDVTMRDFLETHELLPQFNSSVDIALCHVDGNASNYIFRLARSLRGVGVRVAVDVTERRVPAQIKSAVKKRIPFLACIGEQEAVNGTITIKNLATEKEVSLSHTQIAQFLFDQRR